MMIILMEKEPPAHYLNVNHSAGKARGVPRVVTLTGYALSPCLPLASVLVARGARALAKGLEEDGRVVAVVEVAFDLEELPTSLWLCQPPRTPAATAAAAATSAAAAAAAASAAAAAAATTTAAAAAAG